jgi:hypothetical protein
MESSGTVLCREFGRLPFRIESLILQLEREYPSWGVPKIRERIRRKHSEIGDKRYCYPAHRHRCGESLSVELRSTPEHSGKVRFYGFSLT